MKRSSHVVIVVPVVKSKVDTTLVRVLGVRSTRQGNQHKEEANDHASPPSVSGSVTLVVPYFSLKSVMVIGVSWSPVIIHRYH